MKITFLNPLTTLVALVSSLIGAAGAASGSDAKSDIALKLVAEDFVQPIALVPLPDGSGKVVIVDQIGTVLLLSKDGPAKPFFDIRDRLIKLPGDFDERGLLCLAFHPSFKENRKLYAFYSAPLRPSAPTNWNNTVHISEFKVSSQDPDRVDPASERILLEIDKPQMNHNCGRMLFGPDGYLYIGVGDGGQGNDVGLGHGPHGNGQDLSVLLGKILRIDVDKGVPYGIPSDNPFVGGKGRPEIFAYGLRNPWGISFDRGGNHELFAADVGQDSFEEINIIIKGGNYGWNLREGFSCFDPKNPINPPDDCPKIGANGEPLLDPILAYKNFKRFPNDPEARGTSVTGGYVYRGKAFPQLTGKYIFADWTRAWIKPDGVLYVATRPASGTSKQWSMEPLGFTGHPNGQVGAYIVALGENAEGELYVLTNSSNQLAGKNGKVHKLVKASL